ncbi:MAG: T9SS type A sorting domain-containing protein, partial [Crocinitomicaceae bacterium]
DIDTFTTNTVNANWDAFDIHSDILEYEYAIGTLPTVDDVVGWTNNGLSSACSEVLASPIYGQVYHVSIRVTNQAGLTEQFISNGQRFIDDLSTIEEALGTITLYPNPTVDQITISGAEKSDEVSIYDNAGRIVLTVENPTTTIDLSNLAGGQYSLMLKRGQSFVIKQLMKK